MKSPEVESKNIDIGAIQKYEFSGPGYDVSPTAVDHRSSGTYLQQILCIELYKAQDNPSIIGILREAVQETVNEIPILATKVVDTAGGLRELQPHKLSLIIKNLSHVKKLDYETLKQSNFKQEALDADLLLPVHRFSYGKAAVPSCGIQANLVNGGMLLAIGIHHFAMDASGDSFVARVLAGHCRRLTDLREGKVLNANDYYHLSERKFDKSPLYNFDVPGDISSTRGYTLFDTNPPKPAWMKESTKPVSSETFLLSAINVKTLKKDAGIFPRADLAGQEDDQVLQPFVSSHDAVCGLIWHCVIMARVKIGTVSEKEDSNFKMPVEFRSLTDPPLAHDYIGNAFMQMSASLPVSKVIGPNGLTLATHAIREGITNVVEGGAKAFVKVIGQAKNPRGMYANIDDITGPQVLLTSWKKFNDVPIDFGGLGKFERFRLPHKGLIDGCPVILPSLEDGSWEVAMTMDKDVMDELKSNVIWTSYTSVQ